MALCRFMLLSLFVAFVASTQDLESRQVSVKAKSDPDDHCACSKTPVPQCGCCYEFKLAEKDHKACANMTYVQGVKGLRLTVVLDGEVLVNETLSATNPPPFCQGLKPLAYICVKYSNMSYGDDKRWGGCLEIYGGVIVQIIDIKFGCFYLPVLHETEAVGKPRLSTLLKTIKQKNHVVVVEKVHKWFLKMLSKKRKPEMPQTSEQAQEDPMNEIADNN